MRHFFAAVISGLIGVGVVCVVGRAAYRAGYERARSDDRAEDRTNDSFDAPEDTEQHDGSDSNTEDSVPPA